MNRLNLQEESGMREAVRQELSTPLPEQAQRKLDATYAMLGSIPQDHGNSTSNQTAQAAPGHHASTSGVQPIQVRSKRVMKRSMVIAVAAVLVTLLGCTAFAASRLLSMQQGDATFFEGNNLPVYDSLQPGVASLQADVRQTVEVDGMRITLDTVSCDRSIINLFFTLEQDGGFDLAAQSTYEGSQENEWSRLQSMAPRLRCELTSEGQNLGTTSVYQLDAYQENGTIKYMQRIVPNTTLPDQVDIMLEGFSHSTNSEEPPNSYTFDVGLDLSTVALPRELGSQELTFQTSQGEKVLGIERFTASEFGTVMVARNDDSVTIEDGHPVYNHPETALTPGEIKVADDQGKVLTIVDAGDGTGYSPGDANVVEYAGLSPEATNVSFTPMLMTKEEHFTQETVDVSQVGSKLALTEFGGYEVTNWEVSDGTVRISLKPYGWLPLWHTSFNLMPTGNVTPLYEEFADAATGEVYGGYHTAVGYTKSDYQTGDLLIIDSYYAASDEELKQLVDYRYITAPDTFTEESEATVTAAFQ